MVATFTVRPLITFVSFWFLGIIYWPVGWDEIPGARGCTPESCAFRDHHAEICSFGAEVFGLGSQSSDYQREAQTRLRLTLDLLSDEEFRFADALSLPTFTAGGMRLLKRVTLICRQGTIKSTRRTLFTYLFRPRLNIFLSFLQGRT
jgi:hypothetical protein